MPSHGALTHPSLVAAVILFLVALSTAKNSTCYFPDGKEAKKHVPCDPDAENSLCCQKPELCLTNGICMVPGRDKTKSFLRGSCTDKSYKSGVCPNQCLRNPDDGEDPKAYNFGKNDVLIWECGGNKGHSDPADYCCESKGEGTKCCKTEFLFHLDVATIGNPSVTDSGSSSKPTSEASSESSSESSSPSASKTDEATATATATARTGTSGSSSPTNTNEPSTSHDDDDKDDSSGPSTAVKVGVGVGVPLGALLIAAVAYVIYLKRKKPVENRSSFMPMESFQESYAPQDLKPPPTATSVTSPTVVSPRSPMMGPAELPAPMHTSKPQVDRYS